MPDSHTGETGRWTVLDSRLLNDDRWLKVSAERCLTGRGHVLDPYYVLHYSDWAQVVALTEDDQLLLVRQYRHGAQRVTLELPAGAMEPEEQDAIAAARREMLEETGFDAADWRLISSLSPNTATHRNRCHTVLATGARRVGAQALDAGEDIEVLLMPVTEVLAGLSSGLLAQSMHISALMLSLAKLGRFDLLAHAA